MYDAAAASLVLLPWITFRLYLIRAAVDTSPSALGWQLHFEKWSDTAALFDGWWNGLRLLYVYLIVLFAKLVKDRAFTAMALTVVALAIAMTLNIRFAADISRSISNIALFVFWDSS